jgi:hypothetical protein
MLFLNLSCRESNDGLKVVQNSGEVDLFSVQP